MMLKNQSKVVLRQNLYMRSMQCLICMMPLHINYAHADGSKDFMQSVKSGISQIFVPKPDENYNKANIHTLSNFQLDTSKVQELPVIQGSDRALALSRNQPMYQPVSQLSFNETILRALQRSPDVSQSVSVLAGQGAYIDVAKAGYYPQLSGGLSTGDLSSGERGRQLISLNATQMLYDFGKVKSGVDIEQAKLAAEQANVLLSIDNVAYETANAIVNIKRYQEITQIAQQQINGISRIAEIANLRAQAGISTQADPVQARANLEAAQANLVVQQTQLKKFQQKLRTLLGADVTGQDWAIPERVVRDSDLYRDPEFNKIPSMIAAQAQVEVAKFQKQQSKLTNYPTLSVKGSLSQALNGRNPNNNEDDGMYNSIMLEASSNLYQGGAKASQTRAASYAEEAAKAKVNSVYLDVLDEIRVLREEIENKQHLMSILMARKETSIRTRELYQEQYKLGTRSAVDLLNAEQSIHSAAQEIENARYDIYDAIVRYITVTGRSRDLYDLNNIPIQGFEIQP
ncbi:TolC family outer membrane protein [Acinetobacter terrestris]|uniref:TolC family outer membrane protein n=1 Tax=Acinetobacter terrestris TaxID=2529843 RepID=UPI0035237BFC